jgi:hypothetical protein
MIMSSGSSDGDGWPWVIKLRANTNRKDVRTAIDRASREGKPIVFKVVRGGDDIKDYIAEVVNDAVDRNVTVTIKLETDEQ